jgi:CspA family cold shock protein
MKPNDQICYCERCGISFLWSAEEQKQAQEMTEAPVFCPGCRQLLPANGRERGLVKWFHERKHYGFLVRKDQPELFAHGSAVEEGVRLRSGDLVEFRVESNERGPFAADIHVIGHVDEEISL